MGAKQTKIEGSYLPETPEAPSILVDDSDRSNVQDPRSPNLVRTPIRISSANAYYYEQSYHLPNYTKGNNTESAVGLLRKVFFKGAAYNVQDPRSPGNYLNRTPLVFDDSQDKILNLDDTFADLFTETQAPSVENEPKMEDMPINTLGLTYNTSEHIVCSESTIDKDVENETSLNPPLTCDGGEPALPPPIILQHTPKVIQDDLDPRSPTIGVDRTPIIFNDDEDETDESVLLENILATLSLNMSDDSICSVGTSSASQKENNPHQVGQKTKIEPQGQLFRKIASKRLPRSVVNKNAPLLSQPPEKEVHEPQRQVFNEGENLPNSSYIKMLTSKQKLPFDESNGTKRTPLRCIKNRYNLRAMSVETTTNSIKARLPITEFEVRHTENICDM